MSNRLFQGIIHQMRDSIDRVIGVVDDTATVIACSDLTLLYIKPTCFAIEITIKVASFCLFFAKFLADCLFCFPIFPIFASMCKSRHSKFLPRCSDRFYYTVQDFLDIIAEKFFQYGGIIGMFCAI